MRSLATIGYQMASPATLIAALKQAKVEVVVDVRALASSRRAGFAKSRLSAGLEAAGIEYLHLRGLGTPAEGRAAARSGHFAEFRKIFQAQLKSAEARSDLATLAGLVRSGRQACLLCLEASPEHCHRTLVAEALGRVVPVKVVHLFPEAAAVD